jgi:4-hydroxy-3-polyprenylbenzoate decarboxylase
VTPVPDTLSEYQFAGLLRGAKVDPRAGQDRALMVPAEAEIVLEGHVLLDEHADEGPYGDHTGLLQLGRALPVFQVSAVTMRRDPDLPDHLHRRPPDEPSCWRGAERGLHPLLQQQFPEMSTSGCRRRAAATASRWSR